jgi:hypothetical protein
MEMSTSLGMPEKLLQIPTKTAAAIILKNWGISLGVAEHS